MSAAESVGDEGGGGNLAEFCPLVVAGKKEKDPHSLYVSKVERRPKKEKKERSWCL